MRHFFWIKEGLRVAATILAAALIYSLLIGMQSSWGPLDLLQTTVIYLAVSGCIMAMIFSMGLYQTLIPLSLRFGGLRADVITGIQLYRLALILPVVLATAGLAVLSPIPMDTTLVLVIAVFLFFNGLGGVLGAFSQKLSKNAQTALSTIAVLAAVGLLGVIALVLLNVFALTKSVLWIFLGLSVAVYGVCTYFEARAVHHFCVR